MPGTLSLLLALILDRLFGEPRHAHPLVGFGKLTQALEQRFNVTALNRHTAKIRGLLCFMTLTVPLTALTAYISYRYNTYGIFEALVLYLALGARSLIEHAHRIATALISKQPEQARSFTRHIVSRDIEKMTETDMSRAAIESTLENGNDAVFAPLFWFAIGGAPAVVFYRLCNTLDAMWGYRNTRYLHFGWAAARMDDVLNYIPARLTALTYAGLGHFPSMKNIKIALHCWRTQATKCKSPNAGPVMSSGAGALALQLGGPAYYHGRLESCPTLGCGKYPVAQDIFQATRLVQYGIYLWSGIAVFILAGGYIFA